MTPANDKNKRQHERIRITSSKSIWNLSEGGAYIISSNPRKAGSLIHFEYRLGKGGPVFKALAKVVRVLHKPVPKINEPAGMALQFVKMDEKDQENLKKYLEQFKGEFRGDGKTGEDEDFSWPHEEF